MPWIASTQRHYNDLQGVQNETACSLTILGHIAKTGGSSVIEMLRHLGFQELRGLARLTQSSDASSLKNFTARRAFVHIHPWPTELFHLLPHGLAKLRAAYEARGCMVQLVTVLRSPPTLQLSSYRYFRMNGGFGVRPSLSTTSPERRNQTWVAQDFASWVFAHRDMMAAWLTASCPPPHLRRFEGNETCALSASAECPADVSALLAPYDVVGVSERLSEFVWLVAARAGVFLSLNNNDSAAHGQSTSGEGYHAVRTDFTMPDLAECNAQPPASWRSLPAHASREPAGKTALDDATRCDRPLYTKAQERAAEARREALTLHALFAEGTLHGLSPFTASQHCNK